MHCIQKPLPRVSYLSEASWMESIEMPKEEIAQYADPTGAVKRQETFIKYNASLAATKFIPKK